jgi:hypothetical protein
LFDERKKKIRMSNSENRISRAGWRRRRPLVSWRGSGEYIEDTL